MDAPRISQRLKRKEIRCFQKHIYNYYEQYGRDLPWRDTHTTPYHIYISEVMLQQTQVDRVIEKYTLFIQQFPDFKRLAVASFSTVLQRWQGLGYNRRALFLHQAAQKVVAEHNGGLPSSPETLENFPGIGKATAASICVFAFNQPLVFIETNIRSVFIYHFFNTTDKVADDVILPLVAQTLDTAYPARWYSALMDYGTYLKKCYGNPARKSLHYATQSRFEGSDRQIRGMILRLLTQQKKLSEPDVIRMLQKDPVRVKRIMHDLEKEGFVRYKKGNIFISTST